VAFQGETVFDVAELEYIPLAAKWKAMESLQDAGLTRAIGVSNFPTALIYELLSVARIPPAVVQIERHPYNVQKLHVDFVERHHIHVTNYSPLGNPGKYSGGPETKLLEHPKVLELADAHNKTAAQILIRWGIDKGATVIPKSVNPDRIKENLAVFDFQLQPHEVAELDALDVGHRYLDFTFLGVPIFT